MKEIKLGDEIKDLITGLKGIAVARIEYLNGCIQFGLKARVGDAAFKEAEYIDESQLKWVGHGINPKPKVAKEPRERLGGYQADQPKKSWGK